MKKLAADVRDGLLAQPGRAALSMLAVCVGMTALTVLLAVLGGLEDKSRALVSEMGANVFVILPGKDASQEGSSLSLSSLDLLTESLEECRVAGVRRFQLKVPGRKQPMRVFAADENYFQIHTWNLAEGRIPDHIDHKTGERVALITPSISESMNWHIGQVVHINRTPFTITGITARPSLALEKGGPDTSFAPDDSSIFIPLSCSVSWLKDTDMKARRLDMIEVQAHSPNDLESSVSAAQRIMKGRMSEQALTWITPDSLLESIRHLEKIIALTAGSIAFLCLILGGTTLMSLMVANVRDRILEIALRRTIGATSRSIASLFLAEACFVTLTASLLGSSLATLLLGITRTQLPLPIRLGLSTPIMPLIAAVAMGMIFSYLPVRMATAVTPAEALRND